MTATVSWLTMSLLVLPPSHPSLATALPISASNPSINAGISHEARRSVVMGHAIRINCLSANVIAARRRWNAAVGEAKGCVTPGPLSLHSFCTLSAFESAVRITGLVVAPLSPC